MLSEFYDSYHFVAVKKLRITIFFPTGTMLFEVSLSQIDSKNYLFMCVRSSIFVDVSTELVISILKIRKFASTRWLWELRQEYYVNMIKL